MGVVGSCQRYSGAVFLTWEMVVCSEITQKRYIEPLPKSFYKYPGAYMLFPKGFSGHVSLGLLRQLAS